MLDVYGRQGPDLHAYRAGHQEHRRWKDDPKAAKKKLKELEAEAWEDFLDMTISSGDTLGRHQHRAPEEKSL